MATTPRVGQLRADAITEYTEVLPDLRFASEQDRRTAEVHRNHPFMWETSSVTGARLALADAYMNLAAARDNLRRAAARACDTLTETANGGEH